MPNRLSSEEVVTIKVLAEKGERKTQIARALGVSEGTVRYHLRRLEDGTEDGRRDKPFVAERYAVAIEDWVTTQRTDRPINVRELHEHLVEEHDYAHSYRSVLRFVRARYPKPKIRTYRRVETPPRRRLSHHAG